MSFRRLVDGNLVLWASVGSIVVCAVLAAAGTWTASQLFGKELAKRQAEIEAQTLHQQVILSLTRGMEVFRDQRTEYADQRYFQRFARASPVYRVSLANEEGRIFWSTITRRSGEHLEPALIRQLDADRRPIVRLQSKKAGEIDQMMRRMPFGQYDPNEKRYVTSVLTPVVEDGTLVGVVSLMVDSTATIRLFTRKMNWAAMSIGSLLAAIFVALGLLFSRYTRVRNDGVVAAAVAAEARKSESEAREMAGQLQQFNEEVVQLNRKLESNLKQLRDTQDELLRKSKLAQMGQLTATVAHEIRNPLATIRSSVFLVERNLAKLDIDLSRPLARINQGITRCDRIISELLDFTRRNDLRRETLKFDDWLEASILDQSRSLPAAVTIECTLSAPDIEARFDPDRMLRVVINLISNGCEAMVDRDGTPLDALTGPPMIKVATRCTPRGLELTVRDSGPGMSADQLEKVFEPLYTTKSFGVGLGIPAIVQILEQHGGGLEYRSEAGSGTEATAWFPLDNTEDTSDTAACVPERFRVGGAAR